jgi:small-conductance mechanosensitive channel
MEIVSEFRTQFIESAVLLAFVLLVKFLTNIAIGRISRKWNLAPRQKQLSHKIINLFLIIFIIASLEGIWNIDESQLLVFITSTITILGIAFFAQWSLLSNMTASLIIFFNHPLKLGEWIQIMDKDYAVEGVLEDITFFFIHIRTTTGELITIPNNIVIQKMVLTRESKP